MTAAPHPDAFVRAEATRDQRIRGAVQVAVAFYSCSLVVFVTTGILRGNYDFRDIYQVGLPMMVVDGFLAFQLVFLLGWTSRFRPAVKWALVLFGILAVTVLQSAWDTQLRMWSGSLWRDYGTVQNGFIRACTINFYHTGLFVALIAFQASNLALREKERLLLASRASERDAHMLALRFQLNPHFLFNTLNAISSLMITGRPREAEEMIERLSAFLRASLTADPHRLVRLDEEFEMLDTYLEIEGVRFGERLVGSIDLPVELMGALVPPFLLQPIVENAIKYAVAPATRPVEVRISAEVSEGELLLTVEDDGDGRGETSPGTGVGLGNVRERLRLRYGSAARLEKEHHAGGCRVLIRMPLEGVEAGVTAAAGMELFGATPAGRG